MSCIYLLVIVRSDIRMSVGTSDTTAISFIKFDTHSPNTANAFAALHTNGSFPATFLDSIAENS